MIPGRRELLSTQAARLSATQDEAWVPSATGASLSSGEVQLWRATASVCATELKRYYETLSRDEAKRAERMRGGVQRDEFVVGRGLLRILLGEVLGQEAQTLVLENGRFGKPQIDGVHFNVSHSEGLILLALCRDGEVGVDVEWMDESIDALDLAEQSFSRQEYECVAAAQDARARAQVFFRCWTRKEAVAKAHGAGLLLPLASFTVPCGEIESEVVELAPSVGERQEQFAGGNFILHGVDPGNGFEAALALTRTGLTLRRFQVARS